DFGLGDWCHWDRAATTPVEITSSGYYYQNVLRTALFAEILGKTDDAAEYRQLAEKIRQSFVDKFDNKDGSFGDRSLTATAAALYFKFISGKAAEKSAEYLAGQVRSQQHKANFGIYGSKYIPRVLADYGYIDDALEIVTQKEFPGWGWQIAQGATSLWENWNGKGSQNHIMFGDISAWMYQYLGGINPLAETPGFKKFIIKPGFAAKLDYVAVRYNSPYGTIQSKWQRRGSSIECEFDIPEGSTADIILPGKTIKDAAGKGNKFFV
ncbi:MAG: glycoside hydrolase, partial [Lentisphaeria bacterium]|nr:glycoside hydrolase [Lentisphaeria bacterium]